MSAFVSGALISQTSADDPYHAFDIVASVPGTPVLIFDETVPAERTRYLNQILVSTSVAGYWELQVDDMPILQGRTAPGNPDAELTLAVAFPVSGGSGVKLYFTARHGSTEADVYGLLTGFERAG